MIKVASKFKLLSILIIITSILLVICLVYIFAFPTTNNDFVLFIFLGLSILLLLKILYWAFLDNKENEKRQQDFKKLCNKLDDCFNEMILREKIWKTYFDSLKNKENKK